jgi:hypothetical protein
MTDVLALAAWRGTLPEAVVAIGAEPAVIDLATTLSPAMDAAIERAAAAAALLLREWGHVCDRRRPAPGTRGEDSARRDPAVGHASG